MLFVGLLSLVKLIFQHYHFTWPKYVLREHGDTFPLGDFQSINPILIIILVPLVTAFTRHRSAFKCIVVGSFISTASIFVLCLPTFKLAHAWFPFDYPIILASIILLSIGEAFWSPRLYEYTAVIAPKGREASYMGLSSLPFFLAKLMAAPASGYLLRAYCPENGPRHSGMLWLIIGLMTLVGPISILLLHGVIEGRKDKPAAKPEPEAAAA